MYRFLKPAAMPNPRKIKVNQGAVLPLKTLWSRKYPKPIPIKIEAAKDMPMVENSPINFIISLRLLDIFLLFRALKCT
jgi:hypothetical protein